MKNSNSTDIHITLVYGGAASGKSRLAERMCCARDGSRLYVATMRPYGNEAAERICRHRTQRANKGFDTLEYYYDLDRLVLAQRYDTALLEDVGNLVANQMFSRKERYSPDRIVEGIRHLAAQVGSLVVVANDVFADAGRYDGDTTEYLRCMAHAHRRVADLADCVVESVCGLPQILRGELRL